MPSYVGCIMWSGWVITPAHPHASVINRSYYDPNLLVKTTTYRSMLYSSIIVLNKLSLVASLPILTSERKSTNLV